MLLAPEAARAPLEQAWRACQNCLLCAFTDILMMTKRRTKWATITLKNNDVARGRAHQNQSLDGSEDSEAEDLTLDLATYK
jgi:hypothetical protein